MGAWLPWHCGGGATPCARHVQTSSSPQWLPHPNICPPHLLSAFTCPCISWCVTSMCHSAHCSCASAWHFCICHSLLQSWYDSHHMFTWPDTCHVCTCICANWVLPAVCPILQVEIHCVVMSHPARYCCLPKSICDSYFNSMCPDMLAYLLSPISQNYHSTSAHHSPCPCSI